VFTLCGNPNEVEKDHYGLLSIKSLLMAKENTAGSGRHYIFHILHNIDDEELFNTTKLNWEVYRALQREVGAGLVTYHTYHIRELDEATGVALGGSDPNLAVPHHIFKNCAATRIKLPFLLGGKVDRVLYLDWDTVVTCDLTRLWDHWGGFNAAQLLGMASADPSGVSDRDVYRMWNMPRHPTFGAVNSGVMMMHIGRMHEEGRRGKALEFWHAISAIIRSKVNVTGTPQDYWDLTRAFVLGDQDILNALFAPRGVNASWGHPEWLYLIPPQYNFCIDPPFPEEINAWDVDRKPLKSYKRRPAPCIHHFCGNRLMSNDRDKEWLDVKDPHQGLFMYIKHWKLEKHEPPPGMRPPIDGNDPSTWH
jgi:lipopolysaccharide biosynthesis glycosyltransferase